MADNPSIKDQLRSAFRDFRVDGVPASGEHEPVKRDIRTALASVADLAQEAKDDAASAGTTIVEDTRSSLMALAGPFSEGARAEVRRDPAGDVENGNGVYRYSGTSWVWRDYLIPQSIQDEISGRANEAMYGLIRPVETVLDNAHVVTDEEGFVLARMGAGAAMIAGATLVSDAAVSGLHPTDRHGFRSSYIDESGGMIAGLRFEEDLWEPGLIVTDLYGFVAARVGGQAAQLEPEPEPPLSGRPYFSRHLCGVAGETMTLYLRNMLERRADDGTVRAVLGSTAYGNGYARTGAEEIDFRTSDLGAAAELSVRSDDLQRRWRLPMTVATAPRDPGGLGAFNVLGIGDSIWHRQAGAMVRDFLTAWGYAATMIGTCEGSARPGGSGELGEGREGFESGDYTYAVTDLAIPLPPGQEAAYLAMPTSEKRNYNPFIRVATGSDDPSIVRNGYVVDFAFYQSRFSLPTPDIVVYGLGTNDIRDRGASLLYQTVLDNDRLILGQMRAAWPNVKIIRFLPGTARTASRDALWSRYLDVMRAMMDAQAGLSGVTICPAWAFVTPDAGYALAAASPDPTTGVINSTVSDDIHPTAHARAQLFRAVSAYVACAATNLI